MNEQNVKRLNLTLDKEVYDQLKKNADMEYIQVGTYVRQFLMKNLFNNSYSKCLTQNEDAM